MEEREGQHVVEGTKSSVTAEVAAGRSGLRGRSGEGLSSWVAVHSAPGTAGIT